MAQLFWLPDAAWSLIDPHLPRGGRASRASTTAG
jgi:hypothetical protein